MAIRSVYLPQTEIQDNRIRIDGEEHRHLVVARVQPHEVIEIFDGKGTVWTALVESVGKRGTLVQVTQSRQIPCDSLQLILGLAMIRLAAFELALEKVAEIGVT